MSVDAIKRLNEILTDEQKESINKAMRETREQPIDLRQLDNPKKSTISGWVAVDDFGNAWIYHSKPTQRSREFCDTGDYITDWVCDTKYPNGRRHYMIDKDLFPELTPDSDPLEVEITIKPKNK